MRARKHRTRVFPESSQMQFGEQWLFRDLPEPLVVSFDIQVKLFPESLLKPFGERRRWTVVSRLLSLRAQDCLKSLSQQSGKIFIDAVLLEFSIGQSDLSLAEAGGSNEAIRSEVVPKIL